MRGSFFGKNINYQEIYLFLNKYTHLKIDLKGTYLLRIEPPPYNFLFPNSSKRHTITVVLHTATHRGRYEF